MAWSFNSPTHPPTTLNKLVISLNSFKNEIPKARILNLPSVFDTLFRFPPWAELKRDIDLLTPSPHLYLSAAIFKMHPSGSFFKTWETRELYSRNLFLFNILLLRRNSSCTSKTGSCSVNYCFEGVCAVQQKPVSVQYIII